MSYRAQGLIAAFLLALLAVGTAEPEPPADVPAAAQKFASR
jgi:hypothetical protein